MEHARPATRLVWNRARDRGGHGEAARQPHPREAQCERQPHSAEADEIREAVAHVVLRYVRQPLLQIAVRGPDEDQIRKLRLQLQRASGLVDLVVDHLQLAGVEAGLRRELPRKCALARTGHSGDDNATANAES